MVRLTWGSSSVRYYETGIDRGVLYPPNGIGVPWNGLVSISETPTGGSARPFYHDGIKYLQIAAKEEFEATITAFGCPEEFLECDGILSIHNGLYATQQTRRAFGLSYRTFIGSEFNPNLGYKIHLIYGALATPSAATHATLDKSVKTETFNWKIATVPPSVTGVKRTAHYIIDTRYTDSGVLSDLEDILYGTEGDSAEMPSPNELIALFDI